MTDLHLRSATDLIGLLRDGEVGAAELLDHHLDRVRAVNPTINAVIALDEDGARRQARAADEARARGDELGPLHGLPMTLKDVFEVVGMPATCGIPDLAGHMPERDADVVTSLREAGAVIYGKTNVPEGAGDHQSYNAIYGLTRNPWDLGAQRRRLLGRRRRRARGGSHAAGDRQRRRRLDPLPRALLRRLGPQVELLRGADARARPAGAVQRARAADVRRRADGARRARPRARPRRRRGAGGPGPQGQALDAARAAPRAAGGVPRRGAARGGRRAGRRLLPRRARGLRRRPARHRRPGDGARPPAGRRAARAGRLLRHPLRPLRRWRARSTSTRRSGSWSRTRRPTTGRSAPAWAGPRG